MSRKDLAQDVEEWRIAVDEGFPVWYGPLGTQGGASPRFAERLTFEGKRGEHHPACRISVVSTRILDSSVTSRDE